MREAWAAAAALALVASMAWGSAAHGAEPEATDDPMLEPSLALLAVGASTLGAGIGVYVHGDTAGPELCGIAGCTDRPDPSVTLAGTSMMVGGGLLTLLGGVRAFWSGISRGATPKVVRESDTLQMTGESLLFVGLSCLLAGTAALSAQHSTIQGPDNRSDVVPTAAVLLATGGAFVAGGLPLSIYGGASPEAGGPGPGSVGLSFGGSVRW